VFAAGPGPPGVGASGPRARLPSRRHGAEPGEVAARPRRCQRRLSGRHRAHVLVAV